MCVCVCVYTRAPFLRAKCQAHAEGATQVRPHSLPALNTPKNI